MECVEKLISIGGNIAAIATAVVAVALWCKFKRDLRHRTEDLEKYLAEERDKDKLTGDQGARTAIIISRKTKLSEAQIWECSSSNDHIELLARVDEKGFGKQILFRYKD